MFCFVSFESSFFLCANKVSLCDDFLKDSRLYSNFFTIHLLRHLHIIQSKGRRIRRFIPFVLETNVNRATVPTYVDIA